MLGTNDTKTVFEAGAERIAAGMGTLVSLIQQHVVDPQGESPRILVIAPPPLGEPALASGSWDERGLRESRRLADAYKTLAERAGVLFLDAGLVDRQQRARWRPHRP